MNQSASQALRSAAARPATVPLVSEEEATGKVRNVYDDIKATKNIDFVPNIWKALASNPDHLELCWTRLKAIMQPGRLDALTKEIIALAVSLGHQRMPLLRQLAHPRRAVPGFGQRGAGRSNGRRGPVQPDEPPGRRLPGGARHLAPLGGLNAHYLSANIYDKSLANTLPSVAAVP